MKILLIGASHGNELLGVKLYERLLQTRSRLLEHIDFMIGNPRAYTIGSRYIERDLNRSYTNADDSYETRRADIIAQHIASTQPDIILDMHTTNCIQPNCLIIGEGTSEMRKRFLRACHIDTVLQVNSLHDITSISDAVIGYEVPNKQISPILLDAIIDDVERFINKVAFSSRKKLYKMQDKIYKKDVSDDQASSLVNFKMHELGFVPIMTGENSYKAQTDYLGFKASAPEEITL